MTIEWIAASQLVSPRYVSIVASITEAVESGALNPGERLPTHRELSRHLGVAVATVTRAYQEAEQRGLLEARVGRGTFVRSLVRARAPAGPIDLSLDLPIYETDPDLGPALNRLASQGNLATLLRYPDYPGSPRHRGAGARWCRRFGVDASPECVLVCAGAQHALSVLLGTIARPGDAIFATELTYPGVKALARLQGLEIVPLPLDEAGLIPEAFEEAATRTAAKVLYCMPTYHNPTTAVLPAKRRQQIAEIALRHGVSVIEDEVHRLLVPDPPPTIRELIPDQSYFIAGTSKSVAAGLRIGFLVAPREQRDRLARSIWATTGSASPVTAELVTILIEDGTADRVAARKRAEARARLALAAEILGTDRYRGGASGYYVWMPLPEGWTSTAFSYEAQRRGVVVLPSRAYYAGRASPPDCVRICFGAAENRDRLRRGLEVLAALLDEGPDPGTIAV